VGNGTSANLMILFYTLLVLFGSFISPAWNSLMKDNVDKERGNYFGKRNKIIGFVSLGVMLICGVILNEFSKSNLFLGFCILFGIAFIFRMISGILITRYHEPELKLEKKYYFSLTQFVRNIPKSNFGKFALSISLITLATSIASPFFSVYLLRNLGISYLNWTIIVIANLVGYYILMPLWGKFSDKYGNMQVLKWTGFFVAGIPLLWFITSFIVQTNMIIVIGYLILIELFSGFIWAGFNLCATNFIYDAVSREKTALCISYYNVLNGVGVFIGATAGGLIASLNFNILGAGPILIIFLISSILRFLFYILVIPKIKEVREVIEYRQGEFGKGVKELLFPPFKFMKYSH
jgi:MFS family permease